MLDINCSSNVLHKLATHCETVIVFLIDPTHKEVLILGIIYTGMDRQFCGGGLFCLVFYSY